MSRSHFFILLSIVAALSFLGVAPAVVGNHVWSRYFINSVTSMPTHLGGEYFNIAKALVQGRGFSDPFDLGSGATAWMPPLLPALQAVCYLLVGRDVVLLSGLMVFLADLSYLAVGWICVRIMQERFGLRPSITLVIYCGYLCASFHWLFQVTHDIWLNSLSIAGLLAFWFLRREWLPSQRGSLVWSLCWGVVSLINPLLWVLWACAHVGLLSGWPRENRRRWFTAAMIALVFPAIWMLRIYFVLGEWHPIKSNLFFDAYIAQEMSSSGVVNTMVMSKHPLWENAFFYKSYAQKGETSFIEVYRTAFIYSLTHKPWSYIYRVAMRIVAAVLLYDAFHGPYEGDTIWLNRLVHPLPFLCLLFLLYGARGSPQRSSYLVLAALYFAYLLPYVLFSFYGRYLWPLLSVMTLVTACAYAEFRKRFARKMIV